jgi:hypothetical protein
VRTVIISLMLSRSPFTDGLIIGPEKLFVAKACKKCSCSYVALNKVNTYMQLLQIRSEFCRVAGNGCQSFRSDRRHDDVSAARQEVTGSSRQHGQHWRTRNDTQGDTVQYFKIRR